MESKLKKILIGGAILGSLMLTSVASIVVWKTYFNARSVNLDKKAEEWTGKRGSSRKYTNKDSISIPGFSEMQMDKDEITQQVNFYNPEENTSYFVLTIILPGGETIWKSEMIEPGKGLYSINLNHELKEGEYEGSTLKYECYDLKNPKKSLNGTEIKFTLKVV